MRTFPPCVLESAIVIPFTARLKVFCGVAITTVVCSSEELLSCSAELEEDCSEDEDFAEEDELFSDDEDLASLDEDSAEDELKPIGLQENQYSASFVTAATVGIQPPNS